MEKEGLARGIKFLSDKSLQVQCLVTDRHGQVSKWVRDNMKTTAHKFDIWHVAKGKTQIIKVV